MRKVERFLSEAEIARLAVALDAETERTGNPYPSAAVKLLLLTGCRRGEIVNLRWEHVDFERECLRLPDSKTGAKVVYLNAPARALLQELPRMAGNPRVIPGVKAESASAAIDNGALRPPVSRSAPRRQRRGGREDRRCHEPEVRSRRIG